MKSLPLRDNLLLGLAFLKYVVANSKEVFLQAPPGRAGSLRILLRGDIAAGLHLWIRERTRVPELSSIGELGEEFISGTPNSSIECPKNPIMTGGKSFGRLTYCPGRSSGPPGISWPRN